MASIQYNLDSTNKPGNCMLAHARRASFCSGVVQSRSVVGSIPTPAILNNHTASGKQSSWLGAPCRSHGDMISSFMDALLGDVWPRMARTARYERNSRLAAFLPSQSRCPTLPLSLPPQRGNAFLRSFRQPNRYSPVRDYDPR
jgi:hypothetical protein